MVNLLLNENSVFTSERSIQRFIKLLWGIQNQVVMAHQTLSFGENVTDAKNAKASLKRLLDSVHKRFRIASVFVQEKQEHERQAIHFHVLFFVFDKSGLSQSAEDARQELRRYVFHCWKRIQGGNANPNANQLKLHIKDIRTVAYFLKQVQVRGAKCWGERPATNWWGVRNRRLIQENSSPVTGEKVREIYNSLFTRRGTYRKRQNRTYELPASRRGFWFNAHSFDTRNTETSLPMLRQNECKAISRLMRHLIPEEQFGLN